ncbi:MAG: hypothetical protein OXH66_17050, partial [Gemmatimonadetes bacterium]|nr:hypothetical protein [Gemmatimonadota bacterium]
MNLTDGEHRVVYRESIEGALVLLMAAAPAAAQEVIELPTEDRQLNPTLDEIYRVGSALGEDWEQFGNVRRVAFDAAGQLYVFDNQ